MELYSFSSVYLDVLSLQPGAFCLSFQQLFCLLVISFPFASTMRLSLNAVLFSLIASDVYGAPMLEKRIAQVISASTTKWEQACVRDFDLFIDFCESCFYSSPLAVVNNVIQSLLLLLVPFSLLLARVNNKTQQTK